MDLWIVGFSGSRGEEGTKDMTGIQEPPKVLEQDKNATNSTSDPAQPVREVNESGGFNILSEKNLVSWDSGVEVPGES